MSGNVCLCECASLSLCGPLTDQTPCSTSCWPPSPHSRLCHCILESVRQLIFGTVQDMSNNKNEHTGNCAQVPNLYSGTLCKPLGPRQDGDLKKRVFWQHLALQLRLSKLLHACFFSSVLCQNICTNANISGFQHITGHLHVCNTHSPNCIYTQTHTPTSRL